MRVALRPLRRFGQNFLTDKNILAKIFSVVSVGREDDVLEIGPGEGALTKDLAKRCRRLVAVEIDRELCRRLQSDFIDFKNATIVCGDILSFDLAGCVRRLRLRRLRVIANLPYYITSPILEYLFKHISLIKDIHVLVQREVAQRICAAPGTKIYSSFSCFVNYHAVPEILFRVKKGSFRPAPKIESSFLRLMPRAAAARRLFLKDEDLFFKVVRTSFSQRRKRLLSSLKDLIPLARGDRFLSDPLLNKRPEELSLEDFAVISNQIFDFSRRL